MTRNSCSSRPEAGFTLIEILAVLVVVGLALAIVLPNLDRLTPRHRLRAAAREIASTMELCRHVSITRVAEYGIRYTFDPVPTYQVLLPQGEEGEREGLSLRSLPAGVMLDAVILSGDDRITSGAVDVDFSSTGEDGAHIVVLRGEDDEESVISVKFQPIAGIATFIENEAAFEEYRGS